MSRFSGAPGKGAMKAVRAAKRAEAEARQRDADECVRGEGRVHECRGKHAPKEA